MIGKLLKGYLILSGVLLQFMLVAGLVMAVKHFQLTPTQFIVKGFDKLGFDAPWLVTLLSPGKRYKAHVLDGHIRKTRPRIILPQLAAWDGEGEPGLMQQRERLYKTQGISAPGICHGGGLLGLTACWAQTGDADKAERAIALLKAFRLETPDDTGRYGNAWVLAFAYDLLSTYPGISLADKILIEAKLERALKEHLALLDESSPTLWHGRATLASSAWLCAVVLNPDNLTDPSLINRAQGHILDVMRALSLTESWPEGYSYWVNSRAFLLTLAASAYINGLEDAKYSKEIEKVLERVGLWHLYATRPDNRAEGVADEGSRVDLKDETRRPIDIINQVVRSPVLASYSRYLAQLHGKASYYRGYRWGFRLFNDPTIVPPPGIEAGQLEGLKYYLPTASIFGQGAMNLAYIRSGWGADDTFISFRAGDSFVHHGHYDAGHFSLFKGAPLAVNSGTYGDFFSPHRLNYSIRTVAKNSLLVMRPGEKVKPNRFFKENVADGGQRVVIPTGSAIESVAQWSENLGNGLHYEGGEITAYDHRPGVYTYIATDITGAYNSIRYDSGGNGGKVSRVNRELVYLYGEDRLFVHDEVVSTEPSYIKKWLLHTINRPVASELRLLKGREDDGILETSSDEVKVQNGRGYLRVKRLYPEDGVIRLVGGIDYQFYVETDGDDSDLDGENMLEGARFKPWFDTGLWRIEVQPKGRRKNDHFLVGLSPSLDEYRTDSIALLEIYEGRAYGAATSESALVFVDRHEKGPVTIQLLSGQQHLYVFGLPIGYEASFVIGGDRVTKQVNHAGMLDIDLGAYSGLRVQLSWEAI